MEGYYHSNIHMPAPLGSPEMKEKREDGASSLRAERPVAGSKSHLVEPKEEVKNPRKFYVLLPVRVVVILISLYFFICSLDLLAVSFRLLGGKAAGEIFSDAELLQNPVVGLVIGILATVLVQSSSTSTSIIVSLVTAGIIRVRQAIPMIMGANIGTSVTNTIVSMSQIGNSDDFRRAFSGATIHDMFNWLSVVVLLPVEITTHYLEKVSEIMTRDIGGRDAEVELLSVITDPFVDRIVQIDSKVLTGWAENKPEYNNASLLKHCSGHDSDSCLFPFSYDSCAGGLCTYVKEMNAVVPCPLAAATKKYVNAELPGVPWLTGYVAIAVGAGMTFLVQSSSVFTSTLTPLVGIGVISLERMYPLTLGSNIGTTSTAILAALAADPKKLKESLQAAFCHLLFNVTGILLFYVVPFMRFPIPLAKILGETTAKYRWFAALYIVVMFCLFPLLVFLLSLGGTWVLVGFGSPFLLVLIAAVVINILQRKRPNWLTAVLRNWNFLPKPLHSLEPYDTIMMKLPCCGLFRMAAETSDEIEILPV
ncbi:unnamed protein product [Darwinula stevensoni]|uniref:Uncharacterized protein n=1 Tax=Darwinula stevensoni TaxID=69355 RepID=A0A7R9FN67_9CRUS|nr:unnamed protein product [Darwinula stevensoni]CAG0896339.1 unnamed protein product [Darwinula stevensoni]